MPTRRGASPGVAFVECAFGDIVDLVALAAHCSTRLARYKVPVRFVVVAELPRNTVGKIDKVALRAQARAANRAGPSVHPIPENVDS